MIIVRIGMNALPENQKEVMQTLLAMIESTGKERGCLSHRVFRDIEDENVFSLIDEWETREDLGGVVNRRHYPKGLRRGGLGKSGGDLRRPIYEGTES